MTISAGGISAALEDKLHFLLSLPQFCDIQREYLLSAIVPQLQVGQWALRMLCYVGRCAHLPTQPSAPTLHPKP